MFFQVSFFSEGSNNLRFNSRVFIRSQTIILSRVYSFLKIWSSIPLWIKSRIVHCIGISYAKCFPNTSETTLRKTITCMCNIGPEHTAIFLQENNPRNFVLVRLGQPLHKTITCSYNAETATRAGVL